MSKNLDVGSGYVSGNSDHEITFDVAPVRLREKKEARRGVSRLFSGPGGCTAATCRFYASLEPRGQ